MSIYLLVPMTILLIWLPWLWRYHFRPHFVREDLYKILQNHPEGERLKQIAMLLNTLYKGSPSYKISRRERARLRYQEDAFIYGEIDFLSFILLLEKVNPPAGTVFYDLGSGSGKAVLTAALCYDFDKACGIELLPGLFNLSNLQINKAKTLVRLSDRKYTDLYLRRVAAIHFVNANFLDCEFSDGDLVFINATCLSYSAWGALIEKF
ncbi:MAG TPA: hypothetical protein VLH77_02870, partial [Gammaproteobacteria bacterium]|nr:hypothetical protein [Gammaproteobacteria bacterium]